MTDDTQVRRPFVPAAPQRRGPDRLLEVFQTIILVYGGALIGIMSYAAWVGHFDTVSNCGPFSMLFVVLCAALVVLRRRRSQ